MTTLYLTRHGETVDNANQIMQGQTQGQLNDNGIEQARELAQRMRGEQLDAFVSSDLKRAIDTCKIVAEQHPGTPFATTPLLRERDWGEFTGRFIPELKDEKWPDDVESLDTLKARASNFLDFIRHNYNGQRVFAVGHGIINKAIQAVFFNKEMKDVQRMTNCEVRILHI